VNHLRHQAEPGAVLRVRKFVMPTPTEGRLADLPHPICRMVFRRGHLIALPGDL